MPTQQDTTDTPPREWLPERHHALGPITRKQLYSTLLGYLMIWIAACVLLWSNLSTATNAFALGIIFPGGGFIYSYHYVLAMLTLAGCLICLTGHRYVLYGTVVVTAGLAALLTPTAACMHTYSIVPWVPWALIALLFVRREKKFRKAQRIAREYRLRHAGEAAPAWRAQHTAPVGELSDEDLAHARYILDRALQPVDEFNGITEREPYGTSAIRYQLNYAQYALAAYQYNHTPAFRGYLQEAQKRLILKMQDKKAWGYWMKENRWGNLDTNPDPIPRDNIMFSAYLTQMTGLYSTLNQDHQFNEPGALSFRWDENTEFRYGQAEILEKVMSNFRNARYTLFPCEPGWAYTMCNPFGLNSFLIHDRQHGSDYFSQVEADYKRALVDEFMTADGRFIPIRSIQWGINLPGVTLEVNDGMTAYLHHPAYPALMETCWDMMRGKLFHPGTSKPIRLNRKGRDIGNYKRSPIGAYSGLLLAASEMGDGPLYQAISDEIEVSFMPSIENGELIYPVASDFSSYMIALARFNRAGKWHDLVRHGLSDDIANGPLLSQVPYPDMYVFQATSANGVLSIGLSVNNLAETGEGHLIAFSQLQPNTTYQCSGDMERTVTADENGHARMPITGTGRLHFTLHPVN